MIYGLGRKLEQAVLNGDGTDQEGQPDKGIVGLLSGLISGVQTQAYAGDKLTTLRDALTQLEVLGYEAGAFILNPLDWAAIETARATSGSFDLGGPIDRAKRQVWRTQVVPTPASPWAPQPHSTCPPPPSTTTPQGFALNGTSRRASPVTGPSAASRAASACRCFSPTASSRST